MSVEDVDVLEADADALVEKMLNGGPDAKAEDTPPEAKTEVNQEEGDGKKPENHIEPANSEGDRHAEDQNAEPQKPLDGITVEQAAERIANAEERYKNVQAAMTKATQEAADLRKEKERLQEETNKLKAQIEILTQQKTEKPEEPQSDELDQFVTDYDEQKPVVDKLKSHDEAVSKVSGEVEELKGDIESFRDEQKRAEALKLRKAHEAEIFKVHPDAFEIDGSDDFQGWLSRNDEFVPVYQHGTSSQIVRMLDRYKSDVGVTGASESGQEKEHDREAQLLKDAKRAAEPDVSSVQTTPGDGGKVTLEQYSQMLNSMPAEEYLERQDEMDALYLRAVQAA